jgi:pSer/pThr/pTyr-binding forkhead associated (FHA) protein
MTIPLTKPEIIIGRADGNTITVKMPTVSKRNTRIVREDGVFKIEDLRSTNGTYLNGMRVGKKVRITDGAQIVIGKTAQLPGGAREYVFELK